MVDFLPVGGQLPGATMSTFRVAGANGAPAAGPSAPKSRMGGIAQPPVNNMNAVQQPIGTNGIPFSARQAPALDLATVERRGQGPPINPPPKSSRMFGLQEAPTYRPTVEEFKDPLVYIQKISAEAAQYGIAKIVPPESWTPPFAIDTERFHFRTRRQELNSVEGGEYPICPNHVYMLKVEGTRANLNYLDQLAKFHKQHGMSLTRFPSVDKKPLDLFKLKKSVETRGGFERVCKAKKWAEIGRDLGYSGKIMSSLSTSLKNSYGKWLNPYEQYLKVVKPGVQQMMEYENGGPYTPSPAHSPIKKSAQGTPVARPEMHAMEASAALNASIEVDVAPTPPPEPFRPAMPPSGFTAVNAGGFTAVNAQPPPQPPPQPPQPLPSAVTTPIPSSFAAVNTPNGFHNHSNAESCTSTPLRNGGSPMLSAHNTPDLRPSVIGLTPLSNGQSFSQLKRTLSPESEAGMNDDADGANGRRSKRHKKGKCIHMQTSAALSICRQNRVAM
jgi:histone demethylase JARID1